MTLSPETLAQLDQLPEDWELVPVKCHGSRKAPVDPKSGIPLKAWEHLNWERESFASMNGHVNAVGVKLGPPSGGLLQLDFDGRKSEPILRNGQQVGVLSCNQYEAFEQATGYPVTDLPQTVSWSSGKGWGEEELAFGFPNASNGEARSSLAFIIPREFWQQMPHERNWPDDMKANCLQARFGGYKEDGSIKGAQAVILGQHPETNGYFWINSPDTHEVAEAPQWLIDAILTPKADLDSQRPDDAEPQRQAEAKANTSSTPSPFDQLPHERRLEVVRDALKHCTPRGPAGSGTYPAAFDVLCGLVHGLGKPTATALAEDWSPSIPEAGWDLPHKIRDIAKQAKGKRKSIGTVFFYAKRGGWEPPACFREVDLTLNREDALAILENAVRSGVAPAELASIHAELIELSPCSGATLHHTTLAIREEIEQDEAVQDMASHQRRLATVSTLQQQITLDTTLPTEVTTALRIINRYQGWPDTLMLSTILSTSSGLLKIGSRVLANPLQQYSVPMNLFHSIVGKSGRGKTPLDQQLISAPISDLVAAINRDNQRRHEAWWEANRELPQNKREPRPQPRYVTIQDYSGEKLTEILSVHDQDGLGLLIRVDELAGLFKGLNQYRAGAGRDEEQLLELYDGHGHTSTRVSGDRAYSACHASITGGIQDEVLIQLLAMGDGGNGRWARFIFSPLPYRDPIEPPLDPSDEEIQARQAADSCIKQLAHYLYCLPPAVYALDREARRMFQQFEISRRADAEYASLPAHSALLGKSSGKVLRIAGLLHLIHSFADGAQKYPDRTIPHHHVTTAIQLIEYFDAWTMSLYTLAASPLAAESDALLRSIHRITIKSSTPVPWNEIRRQLASKQRKGLNCKQGRALLLQLEELGLGTITDGKAGAVCFKSHGNPFPY